eukprot:364487-Chlamydomonas_euryale.AAC.2
MAGKSRHACAGPRVGRRLALADVCGLVVGHHQSARFQSTTGGFDQAEVFALRFCRVGSVTPDTAGCGAVSARQPCSFAVAAVHSKQLRSPRPHHRVAPPQGPQPPGVVPTTATATWSSPCPFCMLNAAPQACDASRQVQTGGGEKKARVS